MLSVTRTWGLAADLTVLDHALVPYRGQPVYLRLVATARRAADYAAGGFHVSVTRGQAGGCGDLASAISPTSPSKCVQPLGREAAGAAWAAAAQKYFTAYGAARAAVDLVTVKSTLAEANLLADAAYKMEGVEPPRDPATLAPEPPVTPPQKPTSGLGLAALAGGILAATLGVVSVGRRRLARSYD